MRSVREDWAMMPPALKIFVICCAVLALTWPVYAIVR